MDIPTKLIVGLGNPGKEYDRTRHNIGFLVVDAFARRHGIAVTKRDHQALVGDGRVGETRVFLMKPQTYMNLSGPVRRSIPTAEAAGADGRDGRYRRHRAAGRQTAAAGGRVGRAGITASSL